MSKQVPALDELTAEHYEDAAAAVRYEHMWSGMAGYTALFVLCELASAAAERQWVRDAIRRIMHGVAAEKAAEAAEPPSVDEQYRDSFDYAYPPTPVLCWPGPP